MCLAEVDVLFRFLLLILNWSGVRVSGTRVLSGILGTVTNVTGPLT